MKRVHTAGVLLLLAFSTSVAAAELDQAIRAIPGTEAAFVQRFTPKGFKKEQVERGTVTFGTLPQMKWSYSGREPRLFVFDGDTSWLYSPAEKQVQVTRLAAAQKKALPFAFLWSADAKRQYTSTERRKGDEVIVTMKPAVGSAELKSVELRIAAATHQIRRVEYLDRAGNRTVFEFAGTKRSAAGSDSFRFSPPPGVEVIQN